MYVRSFFSYVRRNGMVAALVKTFQVLRWGSGVGYGQAFNGWFDRNEIEEQVTGALAAFPRPSVLIVGPLDLPQCRKYRIVQKLELLRKLGVTGHMCHVGDAPRFYNYLQLATHVVFYRVANAPFVGDYLAEAARLGVQVAYDIDDPIFDADTYRANRNLDTLDAAERDQLLAAAERHLEVMRHCPVITVSTTGMADLVRNRLGVEAHIWRNGIDAELLQLAGMFAGRPLPAEEETVIAYMSGSRAHDRDFESVVPVLAELLASHSFLKLMLVGYVQIPANLEPYAEQIEQAPFGGYYEYFEALSRAQVVIVPLLLDGFNECKSAIRYFEASLLGVPTVAARVGQFREVVREGETGFLAGNEEEWRSALLALVEDATLRKDLGEAARDTVLAEQNLDRIATDLAPLFHEYRLEVKRG